MTQVDPRLAQVAQSHGWLSPLVAILLFLLKWLYSYVHNFGWAIILLTALMKLVLFPFTFRGERGLAKSEESKKKLAYIEQKFKHDPDRLALERAEFIKKHGLPGLSGCLPLLIQFPLFISLNKLLYQAPELYKAPFLWIPDLSATDPYYILPLFVFVGMVCNALVGPPAQRVNMFIFALVFGALTANFSAGLALYAVSNTLLGLLQARLVKLMG
jgi:YidC/Oxa1 family membrane protein insertase